MVPVPLIVTAEPEIAVPEELNTSVPIPTVVGPVKELALVLLRTSVPGLPIVTPPPPAIVPLTVNVAPVAIFIVAAVEGRVKILEPLNVGVPETVTVGLAPERVTGPATRAALERVKGVVLESVSVLVAAA